MKKLIFILCLFFAVPSSSHAILNLQEGEGIDLSSSGAGGTLTVSAENATPTNKGIASFSADDFNVTAGAVSLDYTNGQTASSTLKGFLSAADWSTFNSKQEGLGFTPVNSADWTSINDYPDACGAGGFITGLGDTLTCGTPITSIWTSSSGDVSALVAEAGDTFDASNATSTKPIIVVDVCPETCGVGELCFDRSATAGYNIYGCTEEDVWTLEGSNVSTSPFVATGTNVYLAVPTNDVVIGGTEAVDEAKFSIDGDANQIQVLIQGHSTQTENLFVIQQSDGTDVFTAGPDGGVTLGDGATGGSIKLKESSSPPQPIESGHGQFWVNTIPVPKFTDGNGINWTLLTEDTVLSAINWTTLTETELDGINWVDYAGGGTDVNWASIDELDLTGINWSYYAGGTDVNWAEVDEVLLTGINWTAYDNAEINWTAITEVVLDGINWSYYAGGADVNWAAVDEVVLEGINWDDYRNEDINWASIDELDLTGINWVDYASGGYTNLTSFVDQTAWRVFYSDTNGDVTELALGTDGTYLKSQGATSAPTWATPAGVGGNYSFVLNPQQAKVPTANMMAIEGGLTFWAGLFDDSTDECATWEDILYPFSGTLKAKLYMSMATATANDIVMTIQTACITPGDSVAVGAKTFGTADSITVTVPGTVDYLFELTDSSLQGNSCAAWDKVMFKVCRDADNGNDTATGDARLRGGIIYAE